MKKLFLSFSFILLGIFSFQSVNAQDSKVDASVKKCATSNKALGEKFSFVHWQASLDYFTRKTLRELRSDYTIGIARYKEQTAALAQIVSGCAYLSKAKKDIMNINKLYQQVKITRGKNSFGEEIITRADANLKMIQKMKKYLDNIRKNYKIKKKYYTETEISDFED